MYSIIYLDRIRRIFIVGNSESIFNVALVSKAADFKYLTTTDNYSYRYIPTAVFDKQVNTIFIAVGDIQCRSFKSQLKRFYILSFNVDI